MSEKIGLFDFVKSISNTKKDYFENQENESEYIPFIVNRAVSMYYDCIFFANEMNKYTTLTKEQQFRFYFNAIPKKSRYVPWVKKNVLENIESIMKYYGISYKKSLEIVSLFDEDKLNYIKEFVSTGGKIK